MDEVTRFEREKDENIRKLGSDTRLRALAMELMQAAGKHRYTYHFTWLGRPAIQFPQDLLAIQEIVWRVRPDLIVETGVAHGGGLIFYASLLELIGGSGRVIGIDIDIRAHNRSAIEQHHLAQRITLLQGSSTDPAIVERVRHEAACRPLVLVILDSDHTHAHVARELELYSPLVQPPSYLIVLDTIIEDLPCDYFPDRQWGKGNNPATAVREFLRTNARFVADEEMDAKLLITVAPGGFLRCVRAEP
jgi:cephalosporin hydroxylase